MSHEVLEYFTSRHHTLAATDEGKFNLFIQSRFSQAITPVNVPVIELVLCLGQLFQRRGLRRVARGKSMLSSLKMRLKDEIYDVIVI